MRILPLGLLDGSTGKIPPPSLLI